MNLAGKARGYFFYHTPLPVRGPFTAARVLRINFQKARTVIRERINSRAVDLGKEIFRALNLPTTIQVCIDLNTRLPT